MKYILYLFLLFFGCSLQAQTTVADYVKSRKEFVLKNISITDFVVDTNLSGASNSKVATALAIKKYADSRVGGRNYTGSPTTGQVIKWDGTKWGPADDSGAGGSVVNTAPSISGNGAFATPLAIAQQGATNGQLLKWNGSTWIPSTPQVEQLGIINTTNLVTNGNFSSGLTGWRQTAGKWQVISGVLSKLDLLTYRDSIIQDIPLEIDSLYQLTVTISSYISGGVNVNVGGVYGPRLNSNGTFIQEFTATRDGAGIYIQDLFNSVLGIDNIVLKKITKKTNLFQSDVKFFSNILLGGYIKSIESGPQIWGYFKDGTSFGNGPWTWAPAQPPVSIGMNGMKNGTGVSVGAEACDLCEPLSYSTTVGIGAGRRNKSGHITAYGTGAAQSCDCDAAVFGDEAGANATTYPINAHGYYCLNQSTTGLSTGMGHEGFRNATTGDNNGMGYQIGYNTTTGRIAGLGTQVGWWNTTGRMIGIGRYAGGGQSDPFGANIKDTEMIYIGDGCKKSTNDSLYNSIGIGHGVQLTKPNQVIIGTQNTTENIFSGKIGIGTTPLFQVTTATSKNDFEGAFMINTSTGNIATSGAKYQTDGNIFEINVAGANHVVWPNTARWISPGASAYLSTGLQPHDFYTNSTLRFRINADGSTTNYGNSRVNGNLMIGTISENPLEKIHMKGDFIRIGNMGVNGTTDIPVRYGLKFFANNDAFEHGRIECLNSLSNVFYGRLIFR